MFELLVGTFLLASIALALRDRDRRGDADETHDPERYHHIEVSVYEPVLYIEDEFTGRNGTLPSVIHTSHTSPAPQSSRRTKERVRPASTDLSLPN